MIIYGAGAGGSYPPKTKLGKILVWVAVFIVILGFFGIINFNVTWWALVTLIVMTYLIDFYCIYIRKGIDLDGTLLVINDEKPSSAWPIKSVKNLVIICGIAGSILGFLVIKFAFDYLGPSIPKYIPSNLLLALYVTLGSGIFGAIISKFNLLIGGIIMLLAGVITFFLQIDMMEKVNDALCLWYGFKWNYGNIGPHYIFTLIISIIFLPAAGLISLIAYIEEFKSRENNVSDNLSK